MVWNYAGGMTAPRGWQSDAHPDKVVLAVGKCLGSDDTSAEEWLELSLLTGTREIIQGHARLLRSKSWGDEDHQEHVYWVTPKMLGEKSAPSGRAPRSLGDLNERFPNLQLVSDFLQAPAWLAEHEPGLFAEVCETDALDDSTMPDGTVLDAAEQAAARLGVGEMRRQIDRIRRDHSEDPEAAIGQCKELVESVTKTILGMTGTGPGTHEDIPPLVKKTLVHLGLDPASGPTGGDPAEAHARKRLMGGITSVLTGAAELRNTRGTGHGRSGAPLVDDALARLTVGLVLPAVVYLVEVYQRSAESGSAPVMVSSSSEFEKGISLSIGDHVEHSVFGQGDVEELTGLGSKQVAIVNFGSTHGPKRLVVRYAPLRVIRRI